MDEILQELVAGLLSGGVIAATLGFLFARRATMIQAEIKSQFEQSQTIFASTRGWKERSTSELLGPMFMQLDRTERAFGRWRKKDLYLEAKVVREGNLTIRDLLLVRADLVPPALLDDAGRLVEHYDQWLEEFDRLRGDGAHESDAEYVFVGPQGFPFPRDSADRFQAAFRATWSELYAAPAARAEPS